MTILMVTAGILLALAGMLLLVRLVIGPTLFDRLVALDTILVVVVCGITVRSAYLGEVHALVLVVLVALVGMLSSLAAARLVPEEER